MRACLRSAVPFLLLAACLVAQERRALQGRVLGSDGKPLAGATVTLTTPLAAHEALAAPEVLTATTAADGTFRAALRVGRSYAAGVVGAQDKYGRAAVSAIANGLGAAQFVELRAAVPTQAQWLECKGLAAWGDDAPRAGRLTLAHAPGIVVPFTLEPDGSATLPHLPRDECFVELLAADGSTFWASTAVEAGDEGRITIGLGAPRALKFVARDAAGKPVAGALVEHRAALLWFGKLGPFQEYRREVWRALGTTDADGIVRVRLPAATTADWMRVFRASKPGLAAGIAGFFGDKPADARRQLEADASELHFELAAEQPLTGAVEIAPGRPLAGTDLVVEVTHMMQMFNGGSAHVPLLHTVRTDANGRWSLPGGPAGAAKPRLLALPALSGPDGAQLPVVLAENEEHVAELPAVRLSAMRTIDLQGLRADGGPAEGAITILVSIRGERWFVETWDARHRLDRAGRARVCPPAGQCLLFCTDGDGYATSVVDDKTTKVELRFEPFATATIRCVTADGKPAAGAEVKIQSYSPVGQGGDPEARARSAVAVSLHQWLLEGVKADPSGVAKVRFLPSIAVTQLEVSHGGATSEPFQLAEGEQTVTLRAAK